MSSRIALLVALTCCVDLAAAEPVEMPPFSVDHESPRS